MNELNNTATFSGNYKNIPITITSNTSIVNIVEGLKLIKEANKKNWSTGNLTYTITLENQTEETYNEAKITDVINTKLVDYVKGSVKINNIEATEDEASYDEETHTLTINLNEIAASSRTTVTFLVKKKT